LAAFLNNAGVNDVVKLSGIQITCVAV
jgi:hypothetical protein